MADFKELALDYVLADDPATRDNIAKRAAEAINAKPRIGNPVGMWIQSVGQWINAPAEEDDNLITRAKALSFLATTLEQLGDNDLIAREVELMVTFFGTLFEADVKAGVLPSIKALSRLSRMTKFSPKQAGQILTQMCRMGDDFSRQTVETRTAAFALTNDLISDPNVHSALVYEQGESSGFMVDLLDLARNEKSPGSLLQWFPIMATFLKEYSPSGDVVGSVFDRFSAYFPISINRQLETSSGITVADLKSALRSCFASHHRVAIHAVRFLLNKLDKGDGLTVSVKLDILQTVEACMRNYANVQQGIVPYMRDIWSSLKYEVRNGEVEDTIQATLQVIRAIASRLDGEDLTSFILDASRDCFDDLSNPTYVKASGRLLLSIIGASVSAYGLAVPHTIAHINDQLRRPRSQDHGAALLSLANSILEIRIEMMADGLPEIGWEAQAMAQTDFGILSLRERAYKPNLNLKISKELQSLSDPMLTFRLALAGEALLVSQPAVGASKEQFKRLLSDATCEQICSFMGEILYNPAVIHPEDRPVLDFGTDLYEVLPDAVSALHRVVATFPQGGLAFLAEGLLARAEKQPELLRILEGNEPAVGQILNRKAYISSSIPVIGGKIDLFLQFLKTNLSELKTLVTTQRYASTWPSYIEAMDNAFRHIVDSVGGLDVSEQCWSSGLWDPYNWSIYAFRLFPDLLQFDPLPGGPAHGRASDTETFKPNSEEELKQDILLATLFVAEQLWRGATQTTSTGERPILKLSDLFAKAAMDASTLSRYWDAAAALTHSVVICMPGPAQSRMRLALEGVCCFGGRDINLDRETLFLDSIMVDLVSSASSPYKEQPRLQYWSGPDSQAPSVLLPAVLNACFSAGLRGPFMSDLTRVIMICCLLGSAQPSQSESKTVDEGSLTWNLRSAATALALKADPIEKDPEFVALIVQLMDYCWKKPGAEEWLLENVHFFRDDPTSLEPTSVIDAIFSITSGILKRYTGNALKGLLESISNAPQAADYGHIYARRLGLLFQPDPILMSPTYKPLIKPFWRQKAFIGLVKPMLKKAFPSGATSSDTLVQLEAARYTIAVISTLRWCPFEIYGADDEDVKSVLRMVLTFGQIVPTCEDMEGALEILGSVLSGAPDALKGHINSLCVMLLDLAEQKPRTWNEPRILVESREAVYACRLLAIQLLQGMRTAYAESEFQKVAPRAKRYFALACGNEVREIRKAAQEARIVWAREE